MTIAVDYGVDKPLKTRAAPSDGLGIQRSGDVFRYAGVVDPVSEQMLQMLFRVVYEIRSRSVNIAEGAAEIIFEIPGV